METAPKRRPMQQEDELSNKKVQNCKQKTNNAIRRRVRQHEDGNFKKKTNNATRRRMMQQEDGTARGRRTVQQLSLIHI